jgi:adsorption protein B
LERLAATRCGRPFDPACLTEDYETGYLLHSMGYRQVFVPVRTGPSGPLATREYFPRRFRPAISQRTRWVTGIGLQSWQRHGWSVPSAQFYWFWRDRKGLVGNLL